MRKRQSLYLGLAFSSVSIFGTIGLAYAATSPSGSTSQSVPIYRKIAAGDTLWNLSATYKISVQHLEKWNNLTDNSILQIGQKVIVGWNSAEASSGSSGQSSKIYRKLVAGDTLSGLSSIYNVSIHHLEKWNNLTDNSTLQIGQKVIVGWTSLSADPLETWQGGSAGGGGTLGQEFVNYAEQFIGVPYLWGGESPKGFDCSGLVQYTLEHFGVSIPRTSYDQFNAGTPVSRSDLEPGDLVFFDSDGPGASHDGIYVGNGQFVNAESDGVKVDSVDSGYWAQYYIGARRVR